MIIENIFLHLHQNKELFENSPPYMIIRPYLKEGLYISSGQISKLPVKLTCIHLQLWQNHMNNMTHLSHIDLNLLTYPYEHGDNYEWN